MFGPISLTWVKLTSGLRRFIRYTQMGAVPLSRCSPLAAAAFTIVTGWGGASQAGVRWAQAAQLPGDFEEYSPPPYRSLL
jgi:hypothetical protein